MLQENPSEIVHMGLHIVHLGLQIVHLSGQIVHLGLQNVHLSAQIVDLIVQIVHKRRQSARAQLDFVHFINKHYARSKVLLDSNRDFIV